MTIKRKSKLHPRTLGISRSIGKTKTRRAKHEAFDTRRAQLGGACYCNKYTQLHGKTKIGNNRKHRMGVRGCAYRETGR